MSTCFATYSLRWFKSEHSDFLSHGWLAVVAFGSRFYFTPSVPRFNPGVVIPKTGGGYRRYSQRNC
ncbi:hypothetical protein [Limnospira fusiformis]|uniref:hypothetical protein n=1 Tax=Limnospira fusiformis TaxID=54297 RepID=UPI001448AD35|nr:hypothetical protein HFV01_04350 [Limnospira fusiformis SAG 85.79]QJB24392.1 hypothetical protein HFV01_11055 [Limnospira fusiformis SAG 85.79]